MDLKREDDHNPPKKGEISERQRIKELIASVNKVQTNFQRFAKIVIIFVTAIFVMSGISIAGFTYTLHRVHSSRIEASEKACLARNKQNHGILFVFHKFQVTESDILDLFPIEPNCEHYARESVK